MLGGKNAKLILVSLAAVFAVAGVAHADKINVAVFNFQMKAGPADWKWLEKGLADQMATDFFRSKLLNVMARDQMQYVAARCKWVPELEEKSPPMVTEIAGQIMMDYIISGVYTIADGKIKITAQIISLKTAKEVYRATVDGDAEQTLDLQKQLSAKLLSWFSKVPADEIYKQLPVWTRNIRAAKCVYDGMHLYDQGRYEEAWGEFRHAVAIDKQYMEAWYWVGRMYYFMGRYEHARMEFDKFIYTAPNHPRAGDAIKEYLHSWEKTAGDDSTVTSLYDQVRSRYPATKIYNAFCDWEDSVDLTAESWLDAKTAQLRFLAGNYCDGAKMCNAAAEQVHRQVGSTGRDELSDFAMRCAMADHMISGRVFDSQAINKRLSVYPPHDFFIKCKEGVTELVTDSRPVHGCPHGLEEGRPSYWYFPMKSRHMLLAPEGKVFKSVTITPLCSAAGKVDLHFSVGLGSGNLLFNFSRDPTTAGKEGFTLDRLPRTGMLYVELDFVFDQKIWPNLGFSGLKIDAKLEDLGDHGSVEIACVNTEDFMAYVDDVPVSNGSGLVGLLSPGRHTLRIEPTVHDGRCDYKSWSDEIVIEKGVTTRAEFSLPWSDQSAWRSWSVTRRVCQKYPSNAISLVDSDAIPAIQADDKAIRMIWSYQGDLWSAVSRDGDNFGQTNKLEMPVSSGWMENDPRLFRAESGKFVLAFVSDREARHLRRPYVCWSRDFENWSRPATIVDEGFSCFDLIQDDSGRYIFAGAIGEKVTFLASKDLYEWTPLGELKTGCQDIRGIAMTFSKGRYELVLGLNKFQTRCCYRQACHCQIGRYSSADAVSWSGGECAVNYNHYSLPTLSITQSGDFFGASLGSDLEIYKTGTVAEANIYSRAPGVVSYHPKWGYMIAWGASSSWRRCPFPEGPSFMRGWKFELPLKAATIPVSQPSGSDASSTRPGR